LREILDEGGKTKVRQNPDTGGKGKGWLRKLGEDNTTENEGGTMKGSELIRSDRMAQQQYLKSGGPPRRSREEYFPGTQPNGHHRRARGNSSYRGQCPIPSPERDFRLREGIGRSLARETQLISKGTSAPSESSQ